MYKHRKAVRAKTALNEASATLVPSLCLLRTPGFV